MATSEEVEDLRSSLADLRQQVETQIISGQEELAVALRQEIGESFHRFPNQEEFYQYIQDMEKKFEDDQEAVKQQLVELKISVNVAMAAASAATSSPPRQAFEASVNAGSAHKMHLTQRKGFDGLPQYGGGAQWQDWRFTTVDWLRQERPDFEILLKTIE